MNFQRRGEFESHRTRVNDPVDLERTDVTWSQFAGFGLERQIPG